MKLLTHTRPKSSCPSFSLPAPDVCPAYATSVRLARSRGAASICESCYARKGRFVFPAVKNAHAQRLAWWRSTDPEMRAVILADEVRRSGEPAYFRCYSSGDLDETAFATWLSFAELLPKTRIWIPTRTWVLPRFMPSLQELNAHPRIVVRPSAVAFDDPPPQVNGLSAGHASHWHEKPKAQRACPGDCSKCRICWDQPETSVSFAKH